MKTPLVEWVRLLMGFSLMMGMGYTWIFVKEFDLWLFGIPAYMMGMNPQDLIKKGPTK